MSKLDYQFIRDALEAYGRPLCLVGMMGCGKTAMGRLLSKRLDCPFIDVDHEIELAAGMTIDEFFSVHGEVAFREGETRVLSRLLQTSEVPSILSTGGGAFINEHSQKLLQTHGLSLWLKADFDVLWPRLEKKTTRPLLNKPDPQQTVKTLLANRDPIYATADLTVTSEMIDKNQMVHKILNALSEFLSAHPSHELSKAQ